ncbi:hypothetical protein AM588_10011624 [Phytophthora nicotianae]|uniref:Uncharacterized protein n=1 Tax=Phytophthora nicotianae TaxID=4792 RepID=A0A0W8DR60_PHYNI|nr:hypothetical protein AM588_10011624 [Phytophthora nicotianae]
MAGDTKLNGIETARKGIVEKQPRGGKIKKFTFTLDDGFEVLRTKLFGYLEREPFTGLQLNDERIHFKTSKGASQNQVFVVNADNFETLLRRRAKRVSNVERKSWNQDVLGNLSFEFFLYCKARPKPAPTLHRATAARIRTATAVVERYQENNGVVLGPITLNHLVTTHARQPDSTQFTIPSDNTTRQAMAIDEAAARLATASQNNAQRQTASIRLEINGAWNTFKVDVSSLRKALGLPDHDIFFTRDISWIRTCRSPAMDLIDVDHIEEENVGARREEED